MPESQTHILELHGREYVFHKLPATKAVVLMTRLTRVFGDTLVRLVLGAAGKQKPDSEAATVAELETLTSKIQVFDRLKDDDIVDLGRLILPYVLVGNAQIYKGNDQDIDMKFNGYELDLLPVLWEAVTYNFAPFFEGFRKRFPNVQIPLPTELRQ